MVFKVIGDWLGHFEELLSFLGYGKKKNGAGIGEKNIVDTWTVFFLWGL